ncbi:signal-regulatory protein beta-1-like [Protopterus annectens]|uniref:signal-regulatory protein beta-1-like n=1 Tax=Protopterus annectens TaxID=7888 RepID=UPI001CF9C189|nr:signal-regulatory protein beta-1-like [Protopterus annectens]
MALTCTSEGFYPKDVSVIWWQNGAEIKESMQTVSLYGANKTYKVQSSITVPGKIDSTVTCRINHIALQQPKESIFNMNDLLKGMPSLPSISGPTAQIVLNTYVILSCASEGFYPQDINVTWLQHDRELQGSTSDIHLYGQEKTYRVLSHIIVPARIDSPVTCRINHIALDQPVHSTFEMNSIVKGAPSHPSVYGPGARALLNTNVTLTCTASGFYPSNISVTWWKNDTELPIPKTDVNLNGEDKTYRVQSNITVLAEIDSSVTCKINHTALDTAIHSVFNINDIVKVGRVSYSAIIGTVRLSFGGLLLGVIVFLCYHEMKTKINIEKKTEEEM